MGKPLLLNQSLDIHPDLPALAYPHCLKRSWLAKKCKQHEVDVYDLTKKEVRDKLITTGFRCRVE